MWSWASGQVEVEQVAVFGRVELQSLQEIPQCACEQFQRAFRGPWESPGTKVQTKFVPIHRTATMVDDRYNITEEENDEVLKAHFTEGLDGPLSKFP